VGSRRGGEWSCCFWSSVAKGIGTRRSRIKPDCTPFARYQPLIRPKIAVCHLVKSW